MRNLGEILATIGTFMVFAGFRLAFTKYQLTRVHDMSMFLGGVGFSLFILALAFSLIRKAKLAELRRVLDADPPKQRRIRVLPWYIGVPVAIAASFLLPMSRVSNSSGTVLGATRVIENEQFYFFVPHPWIVCQPDSDDRGTVVGLFMSADSTVAVQKAVIKVEAGRAADPDLLTTARSLAESWGGSLVDENSELAGTSAMRIHASHLGQGMQPIDAIVAIHAGRLYLIMGGTLESGLDVAGALEEIRASWRWKSQ